MIRRPILSLCLLILAALIAQAQENTGKPDGSTGRGSLESKVDKLFSQWDKPDSPGAALIVVKDGSVIYKRGYGSANLEYNVPISPSTVFHVASVSKQFTAFAITMLASQGKLSLDDDIRKHLPDVPDFGKKITIRHLIHHTSGIRDQWELLAMAGWRLDDVITKEHILKMVRHEKELNFDPGQEYLYSNMGYTLLAVIVERVTGQSFRQYTQENIFKPLGMTNTHFHDDHEMIVRNRAYSYAPQREGGYRLSALNYANVGATSLFTTVEDLAKWMQNFEDMKLGGRAVIEQMYQQGVLNNGKKIDYAFALGIGKYRGLKTVGHSGGDAGFRSYVFWFPEQRFAVAVLSNLATFNPVLLSQKVADIYLADKLAPEEPEGSPVERTAIKLDAAIYDSYVGKYLLEPATLVSITKENDHLFGQPAGQPKAELVPESETRFFLKGVPVDITIEFHRDEKGKAIRFTMVQSGRPSSARRVERVSLTSNEQAEYAGDYYSEELGTAYTVTVQDGKLVAQHRRHDDIALSLIDTDLFSGDKWWFRQVRFVRDKENRITGFKLTGGRVRSMRFDKQSK
jgi:CubicO group peptidase (beta-lactamase class C family)